MKIESLNDFLNDSALDVFYPYAFPSDSGACSTVDITNGTAIRGGVQKTFIRILTRETHPQIAINKALLISAFIKSDLKGAFFDGLQVINAEADNPSPHFLGEEDGLYSVSMNYTLLEG